MSPRPLLTSAQKDELCTRYRAGEPGPSLANSFGVSYPVVYRILEQRGVPCRSRRAFSDADAAIVCDLYLKGESSDAIGKRFGVSAAAVQSAVARAGVKPTPRSGYRLARRFTEEEQVAICARYSSGAPAKQVAKEFGCDPKSILRLLKSRNVALRPSGGRDRYSHDRRFFSSIDSEAKAYWLGFLAADGCVMGAPYGSLSLKLQARDQDHIEALKDALGSDHPIHQRVNGGSALVPTKHLAAHLCIRSDELVEDLTSHGVTPRKTHTLRFPFDLQDELLRHYVRGYFDGDGSWVVHQHKASGNQQISFTLYGNPRFLAGCRWYFNKQIALRKRPLRNGNGKVYALSYGGRFITERIYHLLYDDASIWLPRKRENVASLFSLKR